MIHISLDNACKDASLQISFSQELNFTYLTIIRDNDDDCIRLTTEDLLSAFKMIEEMVEQRKPRLLGPNLTDEKLRNQDGMFGLHIPEFMKGSLTAFSNLIKAI